MDPPALRRIRRSASCGTGQAVRDLNQASCGQEKSRSLTGFFYLIMSDKFIIIKWIKKYIMPVSRNRKNHKQKVNVRNEKIKGVQKAYNKMYQEVMMERLKGLVEEHKAMSGKTEDNNVGSIQPQA
jgi:hypothetical protein